jgi:hypothetical protein
VQHRKRKVELLLNAIAAGEGEMHLAEVLMSVRLRVGERGHHTTQAKHESTAEHVPGGFEHPYKSAHRLASL